MGGKWATLLWDTRGRGQSRVQTNLRFMPIPSILATPRAESPEKCHIKLTRLTNYRTMWQIGLVQPFASPSNNKSEVGEPGRRETDKKKLWEAIKLDFWARACSVTEQPTHGNPGRFCF